MHLHTHFETSVHRLCRRLSLITICAVLRGRPSEIPTPSSDFFPHIFQCLAVLLLSCQGLTCKCHYADLRIHQKRRHGAAETTSIPASTT